MIGPHRAGLFVLGQPEIKARYPLPEAANVE